MQNPLIGLDRRLEMADDRVSDSEDRSTEIILSKEQGERLKKKQHDLFPA